MAEAGAATITVGLVEDDRMTRQGLSVLISGTPGYECTHAYESVEEALHSIGTSPPDVVLMDINLPGMPGSEGVKALLAMYPEIHVIMLTNYVDDDKVFESICNGACGYLLKKTPPARIVECVREAYEGGAPMSPQIARKVVALFRKTHPAVKAEHDLTPHEIRILGLLAEGFSYQVVGEKLGVTINTVRNYIRSIYDKLHVHSKSEAVSKALKTGIL